MCHSHSACRQWTLSLWTWTGRTRQRHQGRNQDNQPISPNAVRRIYSRRKNSAAEKRQRSAIRKERLQQRRSVEEDRDGHFSSESGSDFNSNSDSEGQARMSTESRRKQEAREVRRRRAKRRGTSEVLSRGVDKVLALMGSKTNVPTANDRLQMHRDIPYVVSGYLQVTVNTAVITLFGYLVLQAILAVSSEMSNNMDQSIVERKQQIDICSKDYNENHCGTPMAAPKLKIPCAEWEIVHESEPCLDRQGQDSCRDTGGHHQWVH
ncbi:hypothetical protein DL89DRAFT_144477 [Linderina pennispora]|uniref:Brl1/Brr6 domain-containing protein n=1 Tax=Linderina pennispora TaxID=61395 RepID=A0A1Y1WCE0_9FUNG|nr:uncharacterized protein DL89DRAFT_144477 [Linderina pennispora]ORX70998.1 hypothetical protein DL89DRAFT_144477 [Linderina pennispora]